MNLTLSASLRASNHHASFKSSLVLFHHTSSLPKRSFRLPPSVSPSSRPYTQSTTANLLRSTSMQRRRQVATFSTTSTAPATQNGSTAPKHSHSHSDHDHADEHDHEGHSHSHGGIFHSHSHDHSAHDGQAEAVVKFMKGEGVDRGTKVTILGLLTNVGLTGVKGVAGW